MQQNKYDNHAQDNFSSWLIRHKYSSNEENDPLQNTVVKDELNISIKSEKYDSNGSYNDNDLNQSETNTNIIGSFQEAKICRTCLSMSAEYILLYQRPDLIKELEELTSIKINNEDNLPQLICFHCLKRLNDAYQFRKQVQKFNKYLSEQITQLKVEENKFDTIEDDNSTAVNSDDCQLNSDEPKKINIAEINTIAKSVKKLCTICGKIVKDLYHHMEYKHSDQSKRKREYRRLCTGCGEQLTSRTQLLRHRRMHDNKTYPCRECGTIFKTPATERIHYKRVHLKELNYSCAICGRRFFNKWKLKEHETIHTGLKPHQCNVCQRGFSFRKNLATHMRQHSGEHPYKCDQCTSAFKHNVSLKNHMKKCH